MTREDFCEHADIQVVIPVYQNGESLRELHSRLSQVLKKMGIQWRIVFVDDASPDHSLSVLKELADLDKNVTVLSLKNNVGQHRAVLTGLWYCQGECKNVVIMDGDLQDPPEAIPQMMTTLERGFDAVFAGRRGRYESFLRLMTSRFFKYVHHVVNKVPRDAGMFIVLSRQMVDSINSIYTYWPSVVSMVGWTGLPVTSIPVKRSKRKHGHSAINGWARLKAAGFSLLGGICWRCFFFRDRDEKKPLIGQILNIFGYQYAVHTLKSVK